MTLDWLPLSVPPGSTPEEAFMKAAKASQEALGVLLVWTREKGWGGCYAVESGPTQLDPAPAILLANVGDMSIMAMRRVERIRLEPDLN